MLCLFDQPIKHALWHSDYQLILVQFFGHFLGISLALDTFVSLGIRIFESGSNLMLFWCIFRRVRRITFIFTFRGRFIFTVTRICKKVHCLLYIVEPTFTQK